MISRRKSGAQCRMFKFPDTSMICIDAILEIMPRRDTVVNSEGKTVKVNTGEWTVTLCKNGEKSNVTIDETEYALLESVLDVYTGK